MKTTTEVRNQLVSMIGSTIKIAQGYENDFDPAKVYNRYIKEITDDTSDVKYPKTFVCIARGEQRRMIAGEINNLLSFLIMHVVKRPDEKTDVQILLDSAMRDFERFFEMNDTLGGFVQTLDLVEFVTDSGFLDPEGVMIMRVTTERFKYGGE